MPRNGGHTSLFPSQEPYESSQELSVLSSTLYYLIGSRRREEKKEYGVLQSGEGVARNYQLGKSCVS